ncbi:hypothetical protein D6C77_08814 [Aureobasidium pullulans]|nr:hypothetical protein D6C77_08814 [Aureobasidium pullulans]
MGIHEASLGSSKHVSYLHSITSSCGWPDIFPTVLLAPSQRASRRMRSRRHLVNEAIVSAGGFNSVRSRCLAIFLTRFSTATLSRFAALQNTNSKLIVHSTFILSISGGLPPL